jgi:hypothetical protein
MKQLCSGVVLSQKMITLLHQLQWTLMEVVLCLFLEPIIVDLNHQHSKEKEAFVFILLSHLLLEVIHTHQPAPTPPCHRSQ